jgi:hypothetical protein
MAKYRLGSTGGTSPRVGSDFSIEGNRLAAAARNGNGRFEFSADGTSGFNFGNFLTGRTYELSVQMNITVVGSSYAERMSLSLADASDLAVGNVDLGVQIGTDGNGGLGVFKRIDAASNSGGSDINTRIANGLPIGTPINLTVRVVDFNTNLTDYNSSYEILVNGASRDTGMFRFNGSSTDRYLIFDVAAHEGPVYYDNLQLTVTGGGSGGSTCRQPILALSELVQQPPQGAKARLYWTAQPGLAVSPEFSTNLTAWSALTNGGGGALSVTTPHGTIQWLEVTTPPAGSPKSFFRLRRQ